MDATVRLETTHQIANSARMSQALEAQRDAADAESNRAFEDLVLHEREKDLQTRRLVNDALDGDPLRHAHVETDSERRADHQRGHELDDELERVNRQRAALQRRTAGASSPRPSSWLSNATVLAVAGAFTIFLSYLMHSRTVGALGFVLLTVGLGWAVLRRR